MNLANFYLVDSDRRESKRGGFYDSETFSHGELAWHKPRQRHTFIPLTKDHQTSRHFKKHDSAFLFTSDQRESTLSAILSATGEEISILVWRVGDAFDCPDVERLVEYEPDLTRNHQNALQMLEDIGSYLDETDERPPETLVRNVKLLVDRLFKKVDLLVDVDGTADGDILVTAYNEKLDALMMYCNVNGTVLCMSNLPGKQEGNRFDSIDFVLDSEFVLDTLDMLYPGAD